MNLAIITGASSGLGREYARIVAEKYPQLDEILLIARRRERLEELALSLSESPRARAAARPDRAEFHGRDRPLADRAGRARRPADGRRGHGGGLGDVADSTPETQGHMVDLNCRALVMLTTLCLKYMDEGRGDRQRLASIASFVPNPRLNTYSATEDLRALLHQGPAL